MKREELETMTKDELREVAEGRGVDLGGLGHQGHDGGQDPRRVRRRRHAEEGAA
jgi:hypothetical protein